jgi:ribosomal protein L11 methyltransferase
MYIAIDFTISPRQPAADILIAELAELGFEGFLETDTGIQAFIPEALWEEGMLQDILILDSDEFEIAFRLSRIPFRNWNTEWEKNFKPITIDRKCIVRAPFHPVGSFQYDIVIEPKMSFGTGHHETTHLMLQWLLEFEMEGQSVLDMGCGTGVLAILASLKGARDVDAIDNDIWSYENAQENVIRNDCGHIRVIHGDASLLVAERYHLIIANINRNILLGDIPKYVKSLRRGGVLLLSGFYLEDVSAISEKCGEHNLNFVKNKVKNQWVAAKYVF